MILVNTNATILPKVIANNHFDKRVIDQQNTIIFYFLEID